jgi:hypothetical protein
MSKEDALKNQIGKKLVKVDKDEDHAQYYLKFEDGSNIELYVHCYGGMCWLDSELKNR